LGGRTARLCIVSIGMLWASADAAELGPFVSSPVSLPSPNYMFAAAVIQDRLFIVGGCTSGSQAGRAPTAAPPSM